MPCLFLRIWYKICMRIDQKGFFGNPAKPPGSMLNSVQYCSFSKRLMCTLYKGLINKLINAPIYGQCVQYSRINSNPRWNRVIDARERTRVCCLTSEIQIHYTTHAGLNSLCIFAQYKFKRSTSWIEQFLTGYLIHLQGYC